MWVTLPALGLVDDAEEFAAGAQLGVRAWLLTLRTRVGGDSAESLLRDRFRGRWSDSRFGVADVEPLEHHVDVRVQGEPEPVVEATE